MLIAAAATLAVAAALGAYLLPGHVSPHPRPALNEHQARELTDGYRRDAVARIPIGVRYAEAVHDLIACQGAPGQYALSSRYDLMPDSDSAAAGAAVFTALRQYWSRHGYRVVDDTPGQFPQLLMENPADRFRIGVSQRGAKYLRLTISSPCLVPAARPAPPVILQDLATAQGAYEQYVAGQLDQLTGYVAALRSAVEDGDQTRARAAWLTAQLCWDRVGAAYGTFGDLADAIDGLPQGLPLGTNDPDLTGLHRIEYGLWHGEPTGSLLGAVDRLAGDVARLLGTLHEVLPVPEDLPLRVHEILEDALRDQLTGLTDLGGGAGLADTWAGVDATAALLDLYAPLIDARRPGLLPAVRAGLSILRQALESARTGDSWPAPTAVSGAARGHIEAALGGVLETLAEVPGLLEVAGS